MEKLSSHITCTPEETALHTHAVVPGSRTIDINALRRDLSRSSVTFHSGEEASKFEVKGPRRQAHIHLSEDLHSRSRKAFGLSQQREKKQLAVGTATTVGQHVQRVEVKANTMSSAASSAVHSRSSDWHVLAKASMARWELRLPLTTMKLSKSSRPSQTTRHALPQTLQKNAACHVCHTCCTCAAGSCLLGQNEHVVDAYAAVHSSNGLGHSVHGGGNF